MSQNYTWNGWNLGSGYVHDSDCVYQSIHITWSISSHSVYMHPHLSARIYIQSQKNEPLPKLFPQSKYFEVGCMEARALTINSKKTYVRTCTETTDMGKYCMLHSYVHGHCVWQINQQCVACLFNPGCIFVLHSSMLAVTVFRHACSLWMWYQKWRSFPYIFKVIKY